VVDVTTADVIHSPRVRGITAHQNRLPLTNTWLTPPTIIAALGDFDWIRAPLHHLARGRL
jgi:hypothetical protein